jgi:hypothetical protein
MRHWLVAASFALLVSGSGMAAWATPPTAGTRVDADVVISKTDGAFTASGALGTARYAKSGTPATASVAKEIGCYLDSDHIVTCRAVMDTVQAQCVVLDRDLSYTLMLGTLTGESYLEFSAVGSDDPNIGWTCIYVMVDNNSKYYPKMP